MNTLKYNDFHQPLDWLKNELDQTIDEIRHSLRQYGESLDNIGPLLPTVSRLHQIAGIFHILEYYGIALLLEEMEETIKQLLAKRIDKREEAYESLVQGTIALEGYLDRLKAGNNDIPIALLPLLNDLRAARNAPLLTENALFMPDLSIVPQIPDTLPKSNQATNHAAQSAQTLRPYYQAALLSWYRNPHDIRSLKQMHAIVRNLENSSYSPRLRQLWWIIEGLLEALKDKGLSSNVSIRLLLGHTDRQMKKIAIDHGAQVESNPPIELLKNALFYIAQATSRGEKVTLLKKAYQLTHLIPTEKEINLLKKDLRGAKSITLQNIARELDKALQQVKTSIDVFTRNANSPVSQLTECSKPLKQIADTLSLINFGRERHLLLRQIESIAQIIEAKKHPEDKKMMAIASAIVQVETLLDNINNSDTVKIQPTVEETEKNMSISSGTHLPETEIRHLIKIAIDEAKQNVGEIKNNILGFLTSQFKPKLLAKTPRLLNEIKGCFTILSLHHAADLVEAINKFITIDLLENDTLPESNKLDTLAEGIVSLEYYLDAVASDKTSVDAILGMTRHCVTELGYPVAKPQEELTDSIPVLEAIVTRIKHKNSQRTQPQKPIDNIALQPIKDSYTEIQNTLTPNNDSALRQSESIEYQNNIVSFAASQEFIDDEVAEIFIEEAYEAIANIQKSIEALKLNIHDDKALGSIRRAFHTLKGSGQIAGAMEISEFAKGYEEFINNTLCDLYPFDKSALAFMEHGFVALKEITRCFNERTPAPSELMQLSDKAKIYHENPDTETPNLTHQTNEIDALIANFEDLPSAVEAEPQVSAVTLTPNNRHQSDEPTNDPIELNPLDNIDRLTFFEPSPSTTETSLKTNDDETFEPSPVQSTDVLDSFIKSSLLDIEKLENFITQQSAQLASLPVPDELISTIQALHSKATALEIEDFLQTTDLLHQYFSNMLDKNENIDDETIEILREFSSTTREMLVNLQNSNKAEEEPHQILRELELTKETSAPNKSQPKKILSDDELALIEVFLEEAEELIEEANSEISIWQNSGATPSTFPKLQRFLHTIKGSARMADIPPIGDLTHHLESLFESLVEKRITENEEIEELTRHAFDLLANMVEDVKNGQDEIRNDDTLITQITDLLSNKPSTRQKEKETTAIEPSVIIETIPEVPAPLLTTEFTPRETPSPDAFEPINSLMMPNSTMLDQETPEKPEEKNVSQNQGKEESSYPSLDNNLEAATPKSNSEDKKSNMVRLAADVLDTMVEQATEQSTLQNNIENNIDAFKVQLLALEKSMLRFKEQLKNTELDGTQSAETNPFNDNTADYNAPQSTTLFPQTLAIHLRENLDELFNLHGNLSQLTLDTDTLISQLNKVQEELHDTLISSRMISFSNQTNRLQRIVRQTCRELNKKANLVFDGSETAIDRALLEKLIAPLEHIIRNAISHGIETPEQRLKQHKPETGKIRIEFFKERAENIIKITDDGAGIDPNKISAKALEKGLMSKDDTLSEEEALQLILEPGFSTADKISQISGRGIGMDVVNSEIQKLGGSLYIETQVNVGTTFTLRLPFTIALNETLLVQTGEDIYALPDNFIEHTLPIDRRQLNEIYQQKTPCFTWNARHFPVLYLASLFNGKHTKVPTTSNTVALVLLRDNDNLVALHVDKILEKREIVLKPTGPQLPHIRGISGASILPNGKVALIVDVKILLKIIQSTYQPKPLNTHHTNTPDPTLNVLVVDDSVTVRKVTQRFLERYDMQVTTVKDGVEALDQIKKETPTIILLDVEMPRLNGFEVAKQVRNNSQWQHIPIIMITSRFGKKHQKMAKRLGVNIFLGKPYQENELLSHICQLTGREFKT